MASRRRDLVVRFQARLEGTTGRNADVLDITVSDSGIGVSEIALARGRRRGLGLRNIEERLRCYGGQSASLVIHSVVGDGTVVELKLPLADGLHEGSPLNVTEKVGV